MKDEKVTNNRALFSSFILHPSSFLLRHWFLLLLLAGVGLVWFRPGWLQPLTGPIDPRVVVALALFLIACSLPGGNLARSLLRPLPPMLATLVSYRVLPFLGWLLVPLLPHADLQLCVLHVASMPGTPASPVLCPRMPAG